MKWDPEREAEMKRLWEDGYSAPQVASVLGGGVTRSMVLGKVLRMGLQRSGPGKAPVRTRPDRKRHNDGVIVAPLLVFEVPPDEPEAIGPIRDFPTGCTCRFIHGDVQSPDWRCCGAPALSYTRPWCKHHAARVYQIMPTPRRPRKGVAARAVEPEAEAA